MLGAGAGGELGLFHIAGGLENGGAAGSSDFQFSVKLNIHLNSERLSGQLTNRGYSPDVLRVERLTRHIYAAEPCPEIEWSLDTLDGDESEGNCVYEESQFCKVTYYRVPFISRFGDDNVLEMDSRPAAAQGLGMEGDRRTWP